MPKDNESAKRQNAKANDHSVQRAIIDTSVDNIQRGRWLWPNTPGGILSRNLRSKKESSKLASTLTAGISGAASGASTGFALGGPMGAVGGALLGGGAGAVTKYLGADAQPGLDQIQQMVNQNMYDQQRAQVEKNKIDMNNLRVQAGLAKKGIKWDPPGGGGPNEDNNDDDDDDGTGTGLFGRKRDYEDFDFSFAKSKKKPFTPSSTSDAQPPGTVNKPVTPKSPKTPSRAVKLTDSTTKGIDHIIAGLPKTPPAEMEAFEKIMRGVKSTPTPQSRHKQRSNSEEKEDDPNGPTYHLNVGRKRRTLSIPFNLKQQIHDIGQKVTDLAKPVAKAAHLPVSTIKSKIINMSRAIGIRPKNTTKRRLQYTEQTRQEYWKPSDWIPRPISNTFNKALSGAQSMTRKAAQKYQDRLLKDRNTWWEQVAMAYHGNRFRKFLPSAEEERRNQRKVQQEYDDDIAKQIRWGRVTHQFKTGEAERDETGLPHVPPVNPLLHLQTRLAGLKNSTIRDPFAKPPNEPPPKPPKTPPPKAGVWKPYVNPNFESIAPKRREQPPRRVKESYWAKQNKKKKNYAKKIRASDVIEKYRIGTTKTGKKQLFHPMELRAKNVLEGERQIFHPMALRSRSRTMSDL